jgi:hypothetical protein
METDGDESCRLVGTNTARHGREGALAAGPVNFHALHGRDDDQWLVSYKKVHSWARATHFPVFSTSDFGQIFLPRGLGCLEQKQSTGVDFSTSVVIFQVQQSISINLSCLYYCGRLHSERGDSQIHT